MKTLFTKILIFFLLISTSPFAQDYSAGAGIGLGSFNGNFPSQTIFGTKLFLETPSPVDVFNNLQFHFSYGQKLEKFLPGSYNYENYPYYTNFGFSGMFNQSINNNLSIIEGIGLLYLNDRSFNHINEWNWGILIFVGLLTELNNLDLFVNIDYGITLNNTTVNYITVLAGIKFKL